jgi:membrane associated rhomboid family serine protease
MLPIGDTNIRNAGPGFVTIGLILLNILAFIWEWMAGAEQVVYTFGVIPVNILNGVSLATLLTSMFLHGGLWHLGSNMLFLGIFGDNVEAVLGRFMYLLVYLAGGVVASLAHVFINPTSTIPSVGASGAIAAVLGAYVVMFPQSRIKVLYFLGFFAGVTRVAAGLFLGVWFIMQLFNGVGSIGVQTAQTAGVAFWAHIGGFVFGFLVGLVFRGRAQRLQYGWYRPA